ncbi:MAG: NUDIX hydrolase [Chloroflexi bacterium]|nr:NUDIX hydrolase [Chloroflexota bacterium]
MEKWISRQKRFEGRIFSVTAGEARLDDGVLVPREMVEHHGGVAVVPVLGDAVILIRQFRIAINQHIQEIPAGRLEGDEEPAFRARAELEEEVGYRAGRLELAHSYFSSAGFTNERMHIFLAFDLEKTAQNLEFDERIETAVIPIHEIPGKLASGEIEDAKTIIGLRALLARLEGE